MTTGTEDSPTRFPASERLATIYAAPAPYVSIYLSTEVSVADTLERWRSMRERLVGEGAPPEALAAVDERLTVPPPEHAAGVAVLAAADGTIVEDHGMEPPADDIGIVDSLPYVAPIVEWQQRRVTHLVVTVDEVGADVITFGTDQDRIDHLVGGAKVAADTIARQVEASGAELIVVAGDASHARRLADLLVVRVPVWCRVVCEPEVESVDELVDTAVRHVSDTVARTTVGYLRELRFLAAHGAAADGVEETLAALREGRADVLLVHDDPADERRVWIGSRPHELSSTAVDGIETSARLVDAAIRSAVLQGVSVHIIPATGSRGPSEDTAALTRAASALE